MCVCVCDFAFCSDIDLLLPTGSGLLRKKVLEAGEGLDTRPKRGQNVQIKLKTALSDDTVVEEGSDLAFTLGDGDVIQVEKHYLNWLPLS